MWTNIAKPTAGTYTYTNPQGKEQYDQVDVTYDSTSTFYDGVNPGQWTGITKPGNHTWINVAKPV